MSWSHALRWMMVQVTFVFCVFAVVFVSDLFAGHATSGAPTVDERVRRAEAEVYGTVAFGFASFLVILPCGFVAPSHKRATAAVAAAVCCLPAFAFAASRYGSVARAIVYIASVALAYMLAREILRST